MKTCRSCGATEANGAVFFRVIGGIKVPTSRCFECLSQEGREFHRERKAREGEGDGKTV